ncbi:MAG: GNAT family N-acetyltransferase [Solirubrobacteraceae bacterium]
MSRLWLHEGVEIVEFGPLTDAHRRALEGDEQDPFDAGDIRLQFRAKDRHVGLRDGAGRLVASTGMVVVEVEIERERFAVVGLGGVIVNADQRGRGLGRQVVQAALTKARELGPAFAMLFCHDDRAGLYRKVGFLFVDAEVVVRQSAGYASMPQRTMWRPLHDKLEWPWGKVIVHSLPF